MKNSNLILFFLLILSFTACDPSFSYTKKIINSSNYDVLIIMADSNKKTFSFGYNFDTLRINQHSEEIVAADGGLGAVSDYENCDSFNDTLLVKIIGFDSLHLLKDINDNGNWKFYQISEKSGGTGECEFLIEDRIIGK